MALRRTAPIVAAALACACLAAPSAALASWALPALDVSGMAPPPGEARVATGPDGGAVAVWSTGSLESGPAMLAARSSGAGWAAPVGLPVDDHIAGPRVVVGPGGEATAAWTERGGRDVVHTAQFGAGGWGTATELDPGEGSSEVEVVVAPDGTATAVWQRAGQSLEPPEIPSSIWTSRRVAGAWSAPVQLSVADTEGRRPRLAVGPDGVVTVIWWSLIEGRGTLVAVRSSGAGWTAPEVLSDTTSDVSGSDYLVVSGPDGVTTATWTWFDPAPGLEEFIVVSRRFGAGGWEEQVLVSADVDDAVDLGLAAGPDGTAVATWWRAVGAGYIIQSSRRDTGGLWGPTADLSAAGANAGSAEPVIGPDGTVTVIWHVSGDGGAIQTRRSEGSGWGATVDLAGAHGSPRDPWPALAPDGAVSAVWASDAGRVMSSRFRVAPGAPGSVIAAAGDATATVSWSGPALTGGAPVTGYVATASPGGAECATAGDLACTVEGLINGTPYTFAVRAVNAVGPGAPSAPSPAVTPQGPPVAPPPAPLEPNPTGDPGPPVAPAPPLGEAPSRPPHRASGCAWWR